MVDIRPLVHVALGPEPQNGESQRFTVWCSACGLVQFTGEGGFESAEDAGVEAQTHRLSHLVALVDEIKAADANVRLDQVPVPERRLFATTTDVGTAMAETALCSEHNTEAWQKSLISHVSEPDGSDLVFYDCTGNDALSCQVCGWPKVDTDG
jgi:hypothetical protein